MRVRFLDSFEIVGEQAWNALVLKSPTHTIFQTWAWQRAWWRAYGSPGCELRLVAVYEGSELRVLMPLFLKDRVLRFIGHGAADRIDLIYDTQRSADLLALLMPLKDCDDWDEMELASIPDASATWRYLRIMTEEAGFFPLSVHKYPLRGLRLEGQEDRIRRLLHTGVLAKHAGIFMSKGKVVAAHDPVPEAASGRWKDFFIQHIYRWIWRAQPSLFISRQARDFCRGMADDPSLSETAVFTQLYLDDKPAGYHLGFVHEKVFYAWIFAFDMKLKRFSPDDVLWREMVEHAMARGCRDIVFVSSEEAAVKHYADRTGTARVIRVFRSRRMMWSAKFTRWYRKIPLAAGLQVFLSELWGTLIVLFRRRQIIQSLRQQPDAPAVPAVTGGITRPEMELLRRLRPELKDLRMLDIGVCAGRTSIYFSPLVGSYHAFDPAGEMVACAKKNLDDQMNPEDIFLADARRMGFAAEGTYDLILFAGEGIDKVSAEDREVIFKEVRRVGREGAWFCFSSHNLQSLRPRVGVRAVDFLKRFRRRLLMGAANQGLERLWHQPFAVLFDETAGYRRPVYYVTPKEQVRALKELGFHDVRVLSTRTGLEVRDWRRWGRIFDDTLYYLCRV